ncbi:DUF6504 family protein [Sphingomonas sp. ASV193]|uniref:DUF6504 family protein n=1 Tax=Sphingomonas sp. ASV193 TaxID=3144405 RepID=UPI0032E8CC0D
MTRRAQARILSAWLPRLAIERWSKESGAPAEARVALVVEAAHGQRIHAVSDAARAMGARPGMRLTDARALDPGLQAVAADLAGDAALLARLARWAGRWSPLVEVDGDDGLRIDISGVAHLFGGEAGLVRDVEARFAAMGLSVQTAIAATAGAAWALARYGGAPRGQRGDLAAQVAPLPVAALRLGPAVTRTLERLGLKTIGTLAGVERRSLARRFRDADNPLDALDRMLGRKAEPLTATPPDRPPRASLRLAEPVAHPEAAPQALALLVPKLVAELEARKLGARRLVLAGYRVDGEVAAIAAGCALATREAGHLTRLLADRTDTMDPGFGFDGFVLEASWAEPLASGQDGLLAPPPGSREVARLVDRLTTRLGPDRVRRPVTRESHLPERASGWAPAVDTPGGTTHGGRGGRALPHHLLDRPEAIAVIYATPEGLPRRFVWRRRVHDVTRAEGPERIGPEWWRERSSARARDYYRVEDGEGRRFWIYRDGRHGDGRGGEPVWYLHGLFG